MKAKKLLKILLLLSIFLLSGCTGNNTTKVSNANNMKIVSQLNTGRYSSINCGAAAISMANQHIKGSTLELEEINSKFPPTQLYGYDTNEIQTLLNYYGIPYKLENLTENNTVEEIKDNIVKYIDNGNILLLCINKKYIPKNIHSEDKDGKNFFVKINSSYDGVENHYVLCTGYSIVEGELYYEIYDSLENNIRYFDSSLLIAIKNNWIYTFKI